jgi:hypothetical protein
MNLKYENFLRELSMHWAGRSGALRSGIETIAWNSKIPGVTVTDYKAFSEYLKEHAKDIDSRYDAELEKITLKS